MNKLNALLKPLMPLLAVVYSWAVIYVTALPVGGGSTGFGGEVLTWLLTLAAIALTLLLVGRVEPKVFPAAGRFTLKLPKAAVVAGLLMVAPVWLVLETSIVYGFASLAHNVQMEPLAFTAADLREDLLSSVHAVLFAPVLEELCFRQMAISPFRRRGAQVAVCVVVAVLFGMLHVRNFPGAFLSAIVYGVVFIWTRNVWCGVALHAGRNLAVTLLMLYSWLGLGDIQMTKIPVIFLPDTKVVVASLVLAAAGVLLIGAKRK